MIFIKDYKDFANWLKNKNFKKINIIGSPGSGKTTLSNLLKEELKSNKLNIDNLYEEFNDSDIIIQKILKNLNNNVKSIIIDGTYTSIMTKERVSSTNIFILINENSTKCLFRVLKRSRIKKKLLKNEKLSYKLLKNILLFNYKYHKKINDNIPSEKIIYWKW